MKKLTIKNFTEINYVYSSDKIPRSSASGLFILGGSVNQNWGNITSEVSYKSFLHDSDLQEFVFQVGANFRIFKGLSFNINGNYSITDNQINLAGGNLSLEELLLRQQQVKSGYNYFISTGLNYSFGSIYNTIVNPRFNF